MIRKWKYFAALCLEYRYVVINVRNGGSGVEIGDGPFCESKRAEKAVIPPVFIANTEMPLATLPVMERVFAHNAARPDDTMARIVAIILRIRARSIEIRSLRQMAIRNGNAWHKAGLAGIAVVHSVGDRYQKILIRRGILEYMKHSPKRQDDIRGAVALDIAD
ncbi:MAG: hypothetical protein L6Q76_05090, partial [Polyangiaceae bacterium]|nr:hypothetical protein [Polyangiaceae bacterium]